MSIHLTLRHTTIALHRCRSAGFAAFCQALNACVPRRSRSPARTASCSSELVQIDAASLGFEVRFRDRPVLETSPLGLNVDGEELTVGATVGKVETYDVDETYPWHGGHAVATNRCRGAKVAIEHAESKTKYTLDIRAYDDGVAFRFVVPGGSRPGYRTREPRSSSPQGARSGITTSRGTTRRSTSRKRSRTCRPDSGSRRR